MKARLFAGAALAALVGASLPAPAADVPTIYGSLAGKSDDFSILLVAIGEAKEVETLKSQKQLFTLYAPTDAAFRKFNVATIKKLTGDKDAVRKLLDAHIMDGALTTKELAELDGKQQRTRLGNLLKIENLKDGVRVGGSKLVETDIVCSNGVIHVIDTLLPLTK